MTNEQIDKAYEFLNSVSVKITSDTDEVDGEYLTKILGQCSDFMQKLEEIIMESCAAQDALSSEIRIKRDLYKANMHDTMTTDEAVRSLGTGSERKEAAEFKHRGLENEILDMEEHVKRIDTLVKMLERRVRTMKDTVSSAKQQYAAKVDSYRLFNHGDRTNTDALPNSGRNSVLEDDGLSELLKDDNSGSSDANL